MGYIQEWEINEINAMPIIAWKALRNRKINEIIDMMMDAWHLHSNGKMDK